MNPVTRATILGFTAAALVVITGANANAAVQEQAESETVPPPTSTTNEVAEGQVSDDIADGGLTGPPEPSAESIAEPEEPALNTDSPEDTEKEDQAQTDQSETAPQETSTDTADAGDSLHWRDDTEVKRHPGSYIGGSSGYSLAWAWLEANKEHGDLEFGPMGSWFASLRVGDAFFEWLALGFQVGITNASEGKKRVGAFNLLLDASLYPVGGLGIRPAVGLGLGFATGNEEWEFGGGGPGCLSLAVLYEFRITQLFVIAPVAQGFWITGQGFDGLFVFLGIELIKWFETPTG